MFTWAGNFKEHLNKYLSFILKPVFMYLTHFIQVAKVPLRIDSTYLLVDHPKENFVSFKTFCCIQ